MLDVKPGDKVIVVAYSGRHIDGRKVAIVDRVTPTTVVVQLDGKERRFNRSHGKIVGGYGYYLRVGSPEVIAQVEDFK